MNSVYAPVVKRISRVASDHEFRVQILAGANMLSWILGASVFGGILSLIGGVFLLWREKFVKKISILLVSFAVGSLLGAAFFELMPESIKMLEPRQAFIYTLLGILTVFLLEKFFIWHHHHYHNDEKQTHPHPYTGTVIFGDSLHNFIDGLAISASFLLDFQVGITATLAIFLHEIPQEIGDFGILLHAGMKKSKILFYNFISALLTVIGAMLGYFFLPYFNDLVPHINLFLAGTFIYIATSDLIPEIQRQTHKSGLKYVFAIIAGVAIIWFLGIVFPE